MYFCRVDRIFDFAGGLLLLQTKSLADFIEWFSEGGRQPSFKKNLPLILVVSLPLKNMNDIIKEAVRLAMLSTV